MGIARQHSPTPGHDRPARWLTAGLVAASILAATVMPALAADPGATPVPAAQVNPLDAATPTPTATPSASPTPMPSASPSPTATPDPAPDPTASPTPAPDPTPTPTPAPWPTPELPTAVTTLDSHVTFYGQGYGHGVGMSQYGAKGRAEAGQTAEQILAAYFEGSTLSTVTPTRAVRALVLSGFAAPAPSSPLVIRGRYGRWGLSGTDKTFPAGARLKVWRTTTTVDGARKTTWKAKVYTSNNKTLLYAATLTGKPVVRPLSAATRLKAVSRPGSYDTYRGTLTLLLGASTASVVNTLGLDDYLRGVVPVEMPSSWPIEALRAQAIAARSYAVKELNPDTGNYDVFDDTRSQVYRGVKAERSVSDAIIAAEPGAVLRYGTKVLKAFFHSTGGGATENNEYAFVGSSGNPGTKVGYLRGIADRAADGVPYDAAAPYYRWSTSSLTRAQLSAMLARDSRTKVGDVTRLDLRRRGVSGRLYQVVLYGSSGTKTVSADVFRYVYNAYRPSGTAMLRSNLFTTTPLP